MKISAAAVCVIFLVSIAGTLVYAQHESAGQHPQEKAPGAYHGSFIQVRLLVQSKILNGSYLVYNVPEGSNLFQTMVLAEPLGFKFNYTVNPKFGAFITTVNGVYANPSLKQYWALLDGSTGVLLPVGATCYKPTNGQNILFKLSLF